MRKLILVAALAASLGSGPALAGTVVNGSFETPDVATFEFNPNSNFTEQSGIYSNGSVSGFADAPDGTQAAFLASSNGSGSSLFLDVTDLVVGNVYSFSFLASARAAVNFAPLAIDFEGVPIGLVTEPEVEFNYRPFTTASFLAGSASGKLNFSTEFLGNTRFAGLDHVTINELGAGAGIVPEPDIWCFLIAGFGFVGIALRRRRRVTFALRATATSNLGAIQ